MHYKQDFQERIFKNKGKYLYFNKMRSRHQRITVTIEFFKSSPTAVVVCLYLNLENICKPSEETTNYVKITQTYVCWINN